VEAKTLTPTMQMKELLAGEGARKPGEKEVD
jgi:hypothetical protein